MRISKTNLRSYLKKDSGNFSIMTALLIPVILLSVGVAIDISKAQSDRSRLQDSLDTAVLSYAQEFLISGDEPKGKKLAENVMTENFRDSTASLNLASIVKDGDNYIASGTASKPSKSLFMDIFGKDKIDVKAKSTVIVKISSITATVVPDVSWSMRGPHIASAKDAIKTFGEEMFNLPIEHKNRLSMAIVPYSGSVNLSKTPNGAQLLGSWEYSADMSKMPIKKQYYLGTNECENNIERQLMTPMINGSSAQIKVSRKSWQNVVVSQNTETKYKDEVQNTPNGPKTVSVPYTVTTPVYGMRCAPLSEIMTPWTGCVQTEASEFNPSTVLGTNSRKPIPPTVHSTGYRHCPPSVSAMKSNITNESDYLNTANGLSIGYATGHDIGLLWGARTLEPAWSGFFNQDSRPWNDDAFPKFLVYMSDGKSIPIGYEFSDYPSRSEGSIDQNTLSICSYLKDRGVIVYGISYSQNSRDIDVVKECATEKLHFHADLASLDDVFAQIAVDIKNRGIRISR